MIVKRHFWSRLVFFIILIAALAALARFLVNKFPRRRRLEPPNSSTLPRLEPRPLQVMRTQDQFEPQRMKYIRRGLR